MEEILKNNDLTENTEYDSLIETFVKTTVLESVFKKEESNDSKGKRVNCMVIRTGPPYADLIVNRVCKEVYEDDIITITPDNLKIIRSKLLYKPFFSKYYVVKYFIKELDKDEKRVIEWLSKSEYVKLLIFTKNLMTFNKIRWFLKDKEIEAYQFNAYLASKEFKTKYVTVYLHNHDYPVNTIAKTTLELLVRALRGYGPEVNGFLTMLSTKKITPKAIRSVIPIKSKLTISNFGYRLMSGRLSKSEARAFVLERKYSSRGLVNSVREYCVKLERWHRLNMEGKLTPMNIRWIAEEGKKFDIPSKFASDRILEILKLQSYQKVLLIESLLKPESTRYKQLIQLYKVIQLVGV